MRLVAIDSWEDPGPTAMAGSCSLASLFGDTTNSSTQARELGIRRPAINFLVNTSVNAAIRLWSKNLGHISALTLKAVNCEFGTIAELSPSPTPQINSKTFFLILIFYLIFAAI